MNTQTIKVIRYIDSLLTILAECYQHDYGRNEWWDGWAEWSNEWLVYVDGSGFKYGLELYQHISRCNIVPTHVVPHKPIVDRAEVDWLKVGQVIRSHFAT